MGLLPTVVGKLQGLESIRHLAGKAARVEGLLRKLSLGLGVVVGVGVLVELVK